jgi:hypothetical protein
VTLQQGNNISNPITIQLVESGNVLITMIP